MDRHLTGLLATERIAGLQAEAARQRRARPAPLTVLLPPRQRIRSRWHVVAAGVRRSHECAAALR